MIVPFNLDSQCCDFLQELSKKLALLLATMLDHTVEKANNLVLILQIHNTCSNTALPQNTLNKRSLTGMRHQKPREAYNNTVEPPIKDALNKGHLRIKDTIQSTKKSLLYSASTFLTSE